MPPRFPALFSTLIAGMLTVVASGQQPVTLTRITGEQLSVSLDSITDSTVVGEGQRWPLADLVMIQTGNQVNREDLPYTVFLAAGGQLKVAGVVFDGEQFRLANSFGEMVIATDAVKGVLFDSGTDLSRFERAMQDRSVEQDTVIATTSNGQGIVRGLIESIDEQRLTMNHDGRSRSVTLSRIVGVVTADLKPSATSLPRGTVHLTNGASMGGGIVGLQAGKLSLELPGDSRVEIPLESVAMISLQSSRVVYLSDLEPVQESSSVLVAPEFQWQRDASVRGNPLRLSWRSEGVTRQYARGIGTHAASRLEFENPQGFTRFAADVGIDAETEGKGNCVASVWADGIKVWEATLDGASDPVPLNIDITGMNRIALVVRNGKLLDLGDHVDWADARFLKTENGN